MNNKAENLEWTTARENTQHASKIGKLKPTNHRKVRRISPETGEIVEYPSIQIAYEKNKNIIKHSSYINNACSSRQGTSGGYVWEYVEEKETTTIPVNSKVITGYTNYSITSDGKVLNNKTKKFLNPPLNKSGYAIVDLNADNYDETKDCSNYTRKRTAKRKKFRVHRLVAEYFIQNPDPTLYTEVNHKNKKRADNRVENLEWVSPLQNMRHAHNKIVYQYTQDWTLVGKYNSLNEAGEKTGISNKNISSGLRRAPYRANGFYWTYTEIRIVIKDGIKYIIVD